MSISPIRTKSAIAASERGSIDGLMDVGLCATHQTDEIAAGAGRGVRRASVLFFNSISPSVQQKAGIGSREGGFGGCWSSDGPDGLRDGVRPSPGRSTPRQPNRPVSDLRAPDNGMKEVWDAPPGSAELPALCYPSSHQPPKPRTSALGRCQPRSSRTLGPISPTGRKRPAAIGRRPLHTPLPDHQTSPDPIIGREGVVRKNRRFSDEGTPPTGCRPRSALI